MSFTSRMAVVRILAVVALAALVLGSPRAKAAPSQQATGAVVIQGFKFDPATLSVAAGTVVTWTNRDQAPHTATSTASGKFDTGTIEKDQSKSVTLDEAGTFEYFCAIHPDMKGTITVTAAQAAEAATAADKLVSATLLGGAEEVPNSGDPDGSGTSMVTLKTAAGEVCWETRVANITLPAAASHIHRGARGVAGPVVVPLTPPDASGMSSGCAQADAALVGEIAQNPADFYVNVHTSDFPGGAVRGQLAAGSGNAAPAAAPATPQQLPRAGTHDTPGTILAGLALLVLLSGLGVGWSVRRRALR